VESSSPLFARRPLGGRRSIKWCTEARQAATSSTRSTRGTSKVVKKIVSAIGRRTEVRVHPPLPDQHGSQGAHHSARIARRVHLHLRSPKSVRELDRAKLAHPKGTAAQRMKRLTPDMGYASETAGRDACRALVRG
jgi:hypothetical protein